jgi:hypothetical protein
VILAAPDPQPEEAGEGSDAADDGSADTPDEALVEE